MEKATKERKRLTIACNVCRRKKIKCDGIKPTCGKCKKFKTECVYTDIMKKRGPKQGHIDSLEQRLQKMEEILQTRPANNNESDEPSMDTIQHLVTIYFRHFETVSPICDQREFIQKVNDNTCSRFLLYSLLSVAARYSDRPDIVKYPLWTSGERYAIKAREMIPQVIEEATIENIQGLLILTLNEYGLARGSRCWIYSGIAIRMILELGFHKELIFDEAPDTVISVQKWFWYESRRKLFWDAYLQEKLLSAATGRPQMIDNKDCDIFLPAYNSSLDFMDDPTIEIYQQNLAGTRLVKYVPVTDEDGQVVGMQVIPIQVTVPGQHPLFSRVGFESRIVEEFVLLGKIAKLINQSSRVLDSQDIERFNRDLDDWENRLPPHLKNTPVNFERFRSRSSFFAGQFVMAHLFHNALIVLLNRGSLVMVEMPQTTNEEIIRNKNKCLAAADNVTFMMKELISKFDVIPPTCLYLTYTTATVIVNNSFSMDPEERSKAEESLSAYYKFFQGMKLYWAMSEKMYMLMRDLYDLHKKVVDAYANMDTTAFAQQRRLPLADIALSSGADLDYSAVVNQQLDMGYSGQALPQFQSSFNGYKNNIVSFDNI